MSTIYYISSFGQDAPMHGGTLRSMQIREDLNDQFEHLRELEFSFALSAKAVASGLSSLSLSVIKRLFDGVSAAGVFKLGSLRAQIRRQVDCGSIVYLEICGINSVLLGHMLVEHGCFVVCFPHNIEAFVRDVNTRLVHDEFSWMRLEVELYRKAHTVYTISEFDRALIACLGVKAECYSYFPARSRLDWLKSICDKRQKHRNEKMLLLFSSVNNPPTRRAVSDFLSGFGSSTGFIDHRLVVAGRGTEIFASKVSEQVEVLGEVSGDVAESLQIEADLSVIPVVQTTGFLTKLVENNIMRLPSLVLGDYLQAQSLQDYGIYMSSEFDDISNLSSEILLGKESYAYFKRSALNFNL